MLALLGDTLLFPQMSYNATGHLDYDQVGDELSITATPLTYIRNNTSLPRTINPGPIGDPAATKYFTINARIDSAGALIGGVPGDDFVVYGAVDTDGGGPVSPSAPPLLTGEITAFGFSNVGTSDLFDFRFLVTGGSLQSFFNTEVAVQTTSEGSNFSGSFAVDFWGGAKGFVGNLPQRQPEAPKPDLRVSITPNDINRVGDSHTFDVYVEKDDGLPATEGDLVAGFTPANGATVAITLTDDFGADSEPSFSTTCGAGTVNGYCSVTFTSPTPGLVIGNAKAEFEFSYDDPIPDVTLIRDTDLDDNTYIDGYGTGSVDGGLGAAKKRFVDAKIEIAADGVNRVNEAHTFLVTVSKDVGEGAGFVPAAGVMVMPSEMGIGNDVLGGTCGVVATDEFGQCTIIVNSSSAGVSEVSASADVEISTAQGNITIPVATDRSAENSGPATKRWVDAQVFIREDGVNRVDEAHEFVVTVLQNDGLPVGALGGDGTDGYGPAAGRTVTATLAGVGELVNVDCVTNNDGECSIVVDSDATGLAIVTASALINNLGTNPAFTISTTGVGGDSDPARKRWVDAKIEIEEDAVNRIGDKHVFTVTVSKDVGAGFVAASGVGVNPDLTGVGEILASDPLHTCDSPTDAAGQCTIVINSATTGISTVTAAAEVEIDTAEGLITIEVETDGSAQNSEEATKRWVDAKIKIEADGLNRVGDAHTFTVTVYQDLGEGDGFVVAPGVPVAITEDGVGFIDGGTCGAGTGADGTCTVIVNSNVVGLSTVTATATLSLGTDQPIVVSTDGNAPNSAPGIKRWEKPSIEFEKTTNGPSNANPIAPDYDNEDLPTGPGVPILTPNTDVTWTYKVTNTGVLPILASEIDIVDDNGTPLNPADDMSIANGMITFLSVETGNADNILDPGEVWLYQATGTVLALPSGGPTGSPVTFNFEGNTALSGTLGNTRTETEGGISVKANGFSRDPANGNWAKAYLGAYSGGLGVTDSIEGNGSGDTHTVDNVVLRNYVSFRFSETVVVDQAYLGYVVDDSDLSIWIGNIPGAYASSDFNLDDAILAGFVTEVNQTSSSSPRLADINSGNVTGNVVVIAARTTSDENYNDRFKIKTMKVNGVAPGGCYENKAVVTVPGDDDSDLSHYCNPNTPPEPGIDIEKTTNGPSNSNPIAPDYDNEDAASGPGVPLLVPGTSVTWTYKVTNTGNVPYTTSQIAIVDDNGTPAVASDDMSIANGKITFQSVQTGDADNILEPGEVWLYQATGVVQTLPSAGPTGSSISFNFEGNSSLDGTDGNIRSYTAGGVTVKASAFSRDPGNSSWADAWLGAYGGGLGVTDRSEGSGTSDMHTVDNAGRMNYVMFRFDTPVIVDSAFLGYVVGDSDLTVWVGNIAGAFGDDGLWLSDSVLTGLTSTPEANTTTSTSTRTADFNNSNKVGNVVVIAALTQTGSQYDTKTDRFKIETLKFKKPAPATCYENKAVVTALGNTDSDLSHYCNPTTTIPPDETSISGRKFHDVSGNGLKYTSDDVPLGGTTIKLYKDVNGNGVYESSTDTFVASTTTQVNTGYYSFTNLPLGKYIVREVVDQGFVRTFPMMDDYHAVTLATSGQDVGNLDFANFKQCAFDCIRDVKYFIYDGTTTQVVTDLRGKVDAGDVVTVQFTVPAGATPITLSLVSYTAPSGTFVASEAADQQVFDVDSKTFTDPGTYTLTVFVPHSYFQVDFVCGLVIDQLGPAGSNIFYTPQGRLYSADNDGSDAYDPTDMYSSLSGYVYVDADNDGILDSGETRIAGAKVTLEGKDMDGVDVDIELTTGSDGKYTFSNVKPGNYKIIETQPDGYFDGKDSAGSQGGTVLNDAIVDIVLRAGVSGINYNFGERSTASSTTTSLDNLTATVSFWKGSDGQALIKSLNGSSYSTKLGNWLAANFRNLWGSAAGDFDLEGKSNRYVADFIRTLYYDSSRNVEAQALAIGIALYVTDRDLAGTVAQAYGFTTSSTGLATKIFNVGDEGAALGVSNNTSLCVSDILKKINEKTRYGLVWDTSGNGYFSSSESAYRALAKILLTDINEAGGID